MSDWLSDNRGDQGRTRANAYGRSAEVTAVGSRGGAGLDPVRAAVLTDGASRLADRFQQADWVDLLDVLSVDGPGRLIDLVREAEAADTDGKRWPRGKVHDDATAAYSQP
jgi:hypothetical protein